jgi:post-segregation antitoxin (ccd killing protein)
MFRRQENSMSNPAYDTGAGKRKASLTLNADLYAKAKAVGINLSKVAEEAVAQALAERLAEQARADIHQDLRALNAFVELVRGDGLQALRDRRSRCAPR